jgi:hypothetical protein
MPDALLFVLTCSVQAIWIQMCRDKVVSVTVSEVSVNVQREKIYLKDFNLTGSGRTSNKDPVVVTSVPGGEC